MGIFEASIIETLQSLRDKIKSVKKTISEVEVDQIFASDPKPGLSKQTELQTLVNRTLINQTPKL